MVTRFAAAVAWPFWPGRSHAEGAFKIAVISMAFTLYFLFAAEYQFPGGAAQFTDYASALITGEQKPNLGSRDIGYPLLLLLGGWGITHSFIGLLAWHVALAWSIAVAAYGLFGREYRYVGFYTAVAVVLSLSPFLFLKFIHHDLPYIALTVVSLYLLVDYLRTGRVAVFYCFLVALIATCLTRPAGNLLFLPLLVVAWIVQRRQWRHYLAAAAVFAAMLVAYNVHRGHLLGRLPDGSLPSYFGRQLFYNLYVNSADFGVTLAPELGPASARLFEAAWNELADGSLESKRMRIWYGAHNFPKEAERFWFTRFTGQDELFIANLVRHPSHDYFEFFCWAAPDDRLFRDVAFEILRAHPVYPFRYTIRNLALFFWEPGYMHGRFGPQLKTFYPERMAFIPRERVLSVAEIEAYVPAPGRNELLREPRRKSKGVRRAIETAEFYWKERYHQVNTILVSLGGIGLLGLLFVRRRSYLLIVGTTAVFLFYNAVITCAFAEPNYRYHFFVLPLLTVMAGAGVLAVLYTIWRFIESTVPAARPWSARLAARAATAPPVPEERAVAVWAWGAFVACTFAIFCAWAIMTWRYAAA